MTRKGAVYPWLPAIIDEETLAEITTFESGERAFVSQQGRQRRRFWGIFIFSPESCPSSSGGKWDSGSDATSSLPGY
jgi:hypothetical protein